VPIVYLTGGGLIFPITGFAPDDKGITRPVLGDKPIGMVIMRADAENAPAARPENEKS